MRIILFVKIYHIIEKVTNILQIFACQIVFFVCKIFFENFSFHQFCFFKNFLNFLLFAFSLFMKILFEILFFKIFHFYFIFDFSNFFIFQISFFKKIFRNFFIKIPDFLAFPILIFYLF